MTSIPSHLRHARPVEPDDTSLVQMRAEPSDVVRCAGCGVWVDTPVCDPCAPWYELDRRTA